MKPGEAFAALQADIHADREYAWAILCNIAVPFHDATGCTLEAANIGAAYVMLVMFDYDITTHPHYIGNKSGVQQYHELRVAAERAEDQK